MLLLLIKFSSHLRPRKFHRKEKKRKEKKRKVCLSVSIMEVEKIIMEEERRVMVAVDESEESMYALSWCLTNLLSQNSKTNTLILLYVKPPAPVYSSLDAPGFLFAGDVVASMEQYGKDLANSVMSRAEVVYRDCNNPVKVEKKIGTGDAKDVICIAAEKLEADILVMGSHDYGFFKRALLGSVSDHCAKHVKCPLVVVKRPKNVY